MSQGMDWENNETHSQQVEEIGFEATCTGACASQFGASSSSKKMQIRAFPISVASSTFSQHSIHDGR